VVQDVFRVGESEVYSVRGPRGEILVPAVGDVVKELAPADRRIVVDADALGLSNPAENEIRP
jgi:ribosomal 30S subunit maturation factor RimM